MPPPLAPGCGALGEADSTANAPEPAQGASPSACGGSGGEELAARVKRLEAELAGLEAAAKAAPPDRREVFETAAAVAKVELQQARDERRSAKSPEARRVIAERDLHDSHAKVVGIEADIAKLQKSMADLQSRLQTDSFRSQNSSNLRRKL